MLTLVARQPVFDAAMNVFAYALLFRSGLRNAFPEPGEDPALSKVTVAEFVSRHLEQVAEGCAVFVRFTEKQLLAAVPFQFPADKVVVELSEEMPASQEVLEACRRLREAGYRISLEDAVLKSRNIGLIQWASILETDYPQSLPEERALITERLSGKNILLMATRLEVPEDFQRARSEGFTLFQGSFYEKPAVLEGRRRMSDAKLAKLDLIRKVVRENPDFPDITEKVKRDAPLMQKFLYAINTSTRGLTHEITDVQQAVAFLGVLRLKKLLSLLALLDLSEGKPPEILLNAVLRAKLCELLATELGMDDHAEDLFLTGMLSRIDALMDRPLESILYEVPLPGEVRSALRGEVGVCTPVIEVVQAYEAGDWERLDALSDRLRLTLDCLPGFYAEALHWSRAFIDKMQPRPEAESGVEAGRAIG